MPFSWYQATIPADYRKTFPEKHERMLLDDARRRAEILKGLGYDRDYAKLRVRGNLRWEFERHGAPKTAKRAEEVVDQVYGRGK